MSKISTFFMVIGLCVLVVVGWSPANAVAQTKSDSTTVTVMVDSLAKQLTLNSDQKTKIFNILLASHMQTQKDRAKNQGDRRAMFQARRENMEKTDKEIRALLNAEQQKKYDKLLEERRARMRERMGNRPPNWQ